MELGVCEFLWLKIILEDLKIIWKGPMKLYCDNKLAIDIAHDPVQHYHNEESERALSFVVFGQGTISAARG